MFDWLKDVQDWMKLGMLASFGGAASYVYIMITKNRPFRWMTFLANLFIAFFVGKSLGGFIPEDSANYTGWVMLLGFSAYPVLGAAENWVLAKIESLALPGGK